MKRFAFLALLVGLVAMPLFAQLPSGTLSGHVTDGKDVLPGVTVSTTSPNMQGTRTTTTNAGGDYIFMFLPPGEYKVKFELQGFQTIDTTVKVNAAQTQKLDATMPQAKVAEEVTVTGSLETISTSSTKATTVEADLVNKLPVGRDQNTAILLTPGTNPNGPRGATQIAGGFSFENLYMINGVITNENIRQTAIPLYIEDAVQETTTTSSGISAEYGRFAGGVVNTLTKAGGNEFHFSARDSLINSKWTAPTPKTKSRLDKIYPTYEGTLGGFIMKDKLWFFTAGRFATQKTTNFTSYTGIPWTGGTTDKRKEAKLTFSINPDHRLTGSYTQYDGQSLGRTFFATYDTNSIIGPDVWNDIKVVNYTGVLTSNFFIELQGSKRREVFLHYGCNNYDRVDGTPGYNLANGVSWSCSFFAADRGGPETRNNEDIPVKASWFLSTPGAGSHDLTFGVDQFKDMRGANNYQSTTDFEAYSSSVKLGPELTNETIYPVFRHNGSLLEWAPIFFLSQGNDLKTQSAFINDKWRLNNNFSFNIGFRYDKNHATNASGVTTTNDSKVSPRIGITYDPMGDGAWTVNASYGKYVGLVQQNFADYNGGGQPASLTWLYNGPGINVTCDPTNPVATGCLNEHDAKAALFNWFDSIGGINNRSLLVGALLPAYTQFVASDLRSPSVDEFTVGFSKRVGNTGVFKLDYVNRKWSDFYAYNVNTTIGTVDTPYGTFDKSVATNANGALMKKYWAWILQGEFRPMEDLYVGGNWTYSRVWGNIPGENSGSGPIASNLYTFPEYKQASWYAPVGDLAGVDQRNRARVYASLDLLKRGHNRLSVSIMESYASGTPYGAVGAIDAADYVDPAVAAKYIAPPTNVTYYYSKPDAYHWDATYQTDIGLNYAFRIPAFGSDLEFFIYPRCTNVFNKIAQITGDASVNDFTNSDMASFNPFTEKPVEGVNWSKASSFGKPTGTASYQTPRTFTLSVGVRF